MRKNVWLGTGFVAFVILSTACSSGGGDDATNEDLSPPVVAQIEATDKCAPNVTPEIEDQPDAVCAIETDYLAPDLTGTEAEEAAELATQSVAFKAGAVRPSCAGRAGTGFNTCGTAGNQDCCATAQVPGGVAGQLRVNTYELGVYQVTVARYETFVNAFNGNLRSAATTGKLPGWNNAWNQYLPATRAQVDDMMGPGCQARSDVLNYGARTWPSAQVASQVASLITDNNARAQDIRDDAKRARLLGKPVNCVTYYMARAFCAWDGGRLPTDAEWTYAAMGGNQLREYPWQGAKDASRLVTDLNTASNVFTFPADFPYYGNGMNAYHMAPPGQKPAGVARWGHQDMSGNVLEWMENIAGNNTGIVRGGSWEGHADKNQNKYSNYPLLRSYGSAGIRCAYGNAVAPPPPPPPPPAAAIVPVHLHYSAAATDHLQGLTQGEGAPAYKYEGVSFKVLTAASPATKGDIPLYRCRIGTRHFVSNSANCEGQTVEGRLGFVYRRRVAGSAPIYRCLKGNDHLTTLTPVECRRNGYRIEGFQGYALR